MYENVDKNARPTYLISFNASCVLRKPPQYIDYHTPDSSYDSPYFFPYPRQNICLSSQSSVVTQFLELTFSIVQAA